MGSWQRQDLPNLTADNHIETSPSDPLHNCIAWAAGDHLNNWWPFGGHWPKGVPREETLEAFVSAFETRGFDLCEDGTTEEGFEKIAIYVDANSVPGHAALQLPNGNWTSKIGPFEDIEHTTLDALICNEYGRPEWFMKRKRKV